MSHSCAELVAAFRLQAGYCTKLGSPLWGEVITRAADDIEAGGPIATLLADWSGDLAAGVLAVRLCGGLHYLALAGRAPRLASQLPSTGGRPGPDAWPAVLEALAQNGDVIREALARPPQTNEAGRAAALIGGFLAIAARFRLPLQLCDVGASAGLNLCSDRFAYELGPHRWSGPDPRLTISIDWRGEPPALDAPLAVAGRRGCDLSPIDLADPGARLWLEAYVWPDQPARLARLRAAIATAIELGIHVERAAAAAWTSRLLADRPAGQATVVYHSVALQYFDDEERRAFIEALAAAGAAATAERPLAWLRLEYEEDSRHFILRLTTWPGGEERLLAHAHPHGSWVHWKQVAPS
jgi:hypothetical protein